mmetsp:Transcript_31425/g.74955  ORF Transcript_31425/g.74955 Transcript_31425/m.74955 type:complete len:115 (-) Transcript_31425:66-410(-)
MQCSHGEILRDSRHLCLCHHPEGYVHKDLPLLEQRYLQAKPVRSTALVLLSPSPGPCLSVGTHRHSWYSMCVASLGLGHGASSGTIPEKLCSHGLSLQEPWDAPAPSMTKTSRS